MDFKDFSMRQKQQTPSGGNKNACGNVKYGTPLTERQVRQTVDGLQGKSESELMSEIFKRADAAKAEGNFDLEAIRRAADGIRPMLTAEQQLKLDGILEALK